MHLVPPHERAALAPLFAHHRTLRAVIDAVLEGRMGRLVTDGETPPVARDGEVEKVARLTLGCYAVLGGDAEHPAAVSLLRVSDGADEWVLGTDEAWRRRIESVWRDDVRDCTMQTFSIDQGARPALAERAHGLPPGYTVGPLDAAAGRALGERLAPHGGQAFDSPDALAATGLGVVVWRGGELACAATPYAVSRHRAEVAIATDAAHRRRGLAAVAAARMVLQCFDRGLHPEWSASNPVSQRLARSLGYRRTGRCVSLRLR